MSANLSGLFLRRHELPLVNGQPGAGGPGAGSKFPVGIPERYVALLAVL